MGDVDLAALRGAFDACAELIALASVVQGVQDAAQQLAHASLRQLGAVFRPVGFHQAGAGLFQWQFKARFQPEGLDLFPDLLRGQGHAQPAVLATAFQLDQAGLLRGHGGGVDGVAGIALRRCHAAGRHRGGLALLAVTGLPGQLVQVRRDVQGHGLDTAGAVIHFFASQRVADG